MIGFAKAIFVMAVFVEAEPAMAESTMAKPMEPDIMTIIAIMAIYQMEQPRTCSKCLLKLLGILDFGL